MILKYTLRLTNVDVTSDIKAKHAFYCYNTNTCRGLDLISQVSSHLPLFN